MVKPLTGTIQGKKPLMINWKVPSEPPWFLPTALMRGSVAMGWPFWEGDLWHHYYAPTSWPWPLRRVNVCWEQSMVGPRRNFNFGSDPVMSVSVRPCPSQPCLVPAVTVHASSGPGPLIHPSKICWDSDNKVSEPRFSVVWWKWAPYMNSLFSVWNPCKMPVSILKALQGEKSHTTIGRLEFTKHHQFPLLCWFFIFWRYFIH